MAKLKREGTCHICGDIGKLSFEHVPPKAAFNARPICTPDIKKVIDNLDPEILHELKGKVSQLGAGGYTLCEPCNNNTGSWYGTYYASWAYQAFFYVSRAKGNLSLAYPYNIFPLHVIKQIICIFFSANPPGFRAINSELVRFVLNPRAKYLAPSIRVYVAYTNSKTSRQSAETGMLTLKPDFCGFNTKVFSEISFSPFTYVLCFDSDPPDARLVDISFFAEFGYKEFAPLNLSIPILPVNTWIPGDFRGLDELIRGARD